jgi:hypothetical protein
VERDEEALAHNALEPQVNDQQHHAKEIERLGQQLLAVLVLQHRVERLLDKDALVEVLQEAVEVLHVPGGPRYGQPASRRRPRGAGGPHLSTDSKAL